MKLVGIFGPAVADVGAIVHVGDKNVFGARVNLGLGLLHGLADADDDENDAGGAGDQPLAIDFLYIFDVNAFHVGFFEDDGVVLGEGFERGVVVEGKWRDDDSNANLKTAASAPFGLDAGGKFPEEITDGREHAFLLNADGGIAESRCEFQGIDSIVVDDAVQIDIPDVTFCSKLGLHLDERAIEEEVLLQHDADLPSHPARVELGRDRSGGGADSGRDLRPAYRRKRWMAAVHDPPAAVLPSGQALRGHDRQRLSADRRGKVVSPLDGSPGKQIAHHESEVRRSLGQPAHEPRKPLRSVTDQHPNAIAGLRQPHLLRALNAIEKLKLHGLLGQAQLLRSLFDPLNQPEIVGGEAGPRSGLAHLGIQ